MQVRNRLASLIFRLIALTVLIVAFSYVMNSPTNSWELMLRFGILTALLEIFVFSIELINNSIDMRRGIHGIPAGIYMPLRLLTTSYTTYSFLLFFINNGFDGKTPELTLVLFHVALLSFSLLDWILFCEKGTVKWYTSFTGLFFPLMYALFLYFRTLIWPDAFFENGGKYPYNILNKDYGEIALSAFLLVITIIALSALLILINNLLAGKYKKRQSYID